VEYEYGWGAEEWVEEVVVGETEGECC